MHEHVLPNLINLRRISQRSAHPCIISKDGKSNSLMDIMEACPHSATITSLQFSDRSLDSYPSALHTITLRSSHSLRGGKPPISLTTLFLIADTTPLRRLRLPALQHFYLQIVSDKPLDVLGEFLHRHEEKLRTIAILSLFATVDTHVLHRTANSFMELHTLRLSSRRYNFYHFTESFLAGLLLFVKARPKVVDVALLGWGSELYPKLFVPLMNEMVQRPDDRPFPDDYCLGQH